MKKSEEIKALIDAKESEYEKLVHDTFGTDAYETMWQTQGRQLTREIRALEFEYGKELNREIAVGDGATMRLYSDSEAGTVIARTAKTLTFQRDKATLDPNFKPEWIAGGFAGHCTNQNEQTYTYERDPNGAITKFYWSEKNGCWQTGGDGSIHLTRGRHEFYDYNF